MRDVIDVKRSIDTVLIPYADCFGWAEFGSVGNACYDPFIWDTPEDENEEAYTLAAVQLAMGKFTTRHLQLAEAVAKSTGNLYVTYPWLRDSVSRLLALTTYDELLSQAKLAKKVRGAMTAKGLTEIDSLSETPFFFE